MGRSGLLSVGLVAALLAGCAGGSRTGGDESVFAFLNDLMPPTPSEAARDAFNPYDADQRRKAINLLSNAPFGGEEPYLKAYRLMLTPGMADEDPTVRAAALRALGRHGLPEDVKLIIPYLSPQQPKFVRLEAATALQRLHAGQAIDPLIASLRDDEAAEVRIAAADALAQYPDPRVFQALVGALHDTDYAVVTQAVHSLELLTGRKFGEDGAQWLAWADQTDQLFAESGEYYYPQYIKPPSLLDRMQFWKKPKKVEPRQPKGLTSGDGSEPVS